MYANSFKHKKVGMLPNKWMRWWTIHALFEQQEYYEALHIMLIKALSGLEMSCTSLRHRCIRISGQDARENDSTTSMWGHVSLHAGNSLPSAEQLNSKGSGAPNNMLDRTQTERGKNIRINILKMLQEKSPTPNTDSLVRTLQGKQLIFWIIKKHLVYGWTTALEVANWPIWKHKHFPFVCLRPESSAVLFTTQYRNPTCSMIRTITTHKW